ncbi:MAG: hypothetical protein U9N30_06305 [Campylobacterota bacterium]|nr:hypothetical protein [Campylobacterota bacterium]
MKKYLYGLIGIGLLFSGCTENTGQPTTPASVKKQTSSQSKSTTIQKNTSFKPQQVKSKDFTISNQNGILMMNEKGREYILTSRGLDYNPHLSSDQNVLVVDVLLMSNLQTIKIFTKKENQRFRKSNRMVSTKLWERHLKDKNYLITDVRYPKLQFRDWVDNDTFSVELSGEVNDKPIQEILRYDIKFK